MIDKIHSKVGFGTAHISNNDLIKMLCSILCQKTTYSPLLIDTAISYNTERAIGALLTEFKSYRDSLFISSKINYENQKNSVIRAVKNSLKILNVNRVDLYSIHSPRYAKYVETWKELEAIKKEGLVNYLGVSNFGIEQIENILNIAKTPIYSNQIPISYGLKLPMDTISFCKKENIEIHACMPFKGISYPETSDFLEEISIKYNCTIYQIVINWLLFHNITPIFGTTKIEHYFSNIKNIKLSNKDKRKLDKYAGYYEK